MRSLHPDIHGLVAWDGLNHDVQKCPAQVLLCDSAAAARGSPLPEVSTANKVLHEGLHCLRSSVARGPSPLH